MYTLPVELLELFETQVEGEFPFDREILFTSDAGYDYDSNWKFNVQKGVGILKCSLRDVQGNEEDFEWVLTLK
jgi:hypothetical protein